MLLKYAYWNTNQSTSSNSSFFLSGKQNQRLGDMKPTATMGLKKKISVSETDSRLTAFFPCKCVIWKVQSKIQQTKIAVTKN